MPAVLMCGLAVSVGSAAFAANALGFMLSDKKAGAFKMEIESIKVERAGK